MTLLDKVPQNRIEVPRKVPPTCVSPQLGAWHTKTMTQTQTLTQTQLMRAAAAEYGWTLNYGDIALMWRGGCIIRARFLGDIKQAFDADVALPNLLLAPYFKNAIDRCQGAWRRVIARAVENGVPVPAFSSALAYYDAYRSGVLPANLLQAQRDYFGAHTYERTDKPKGQFFHTDWTGEGGDTASTRYDV